MIEMTWNQLRSPDLNPVLQKIVRAPGSFKTSIKILAIIKAVEAEQKSAADAFNVLTEKYMKLSDDKTHWMAKEDVLEEANKALNDFASTEFKKDLPRITYSEMERVELSAHDIAILEPFLKDDLTKPDLKVAPDVQANS